MTEQTITVELTVSEARALRNMGELMIGSLEQAGCNMTDEVELPDGGIGPVPLLMGCMKLELALAMQGAEI